MWLHNNIYILYTYYVYDIYVIFYHNNFQLKLKKKKKLKKNEADYDLINTYQNNSRDANRKLYDSPVTWIR